MKKLNLLFCFLFFLGQVTICLAQQPTPMTTMDSLMRYKWEYLHDSEDVKISDIFLIFTQTEFRSIAKFLDDDELFDDSSTYYLNYTGNRLFDHSKVGIVENGRYIVVLDQFGCVNYWIKSLTDTTLELYKFYPSFNRVLSTWIARPL